MAKWNLDPVHSEIKFKAKHLVVSSVSGNFSDFEGTVEAEKDDFSDAKIYFEAETNSVSTGNEKRDNHLKSEDFFDAKNYAKLTYKSKSIKKLNENEYEIFGDMTIRGKTHGLKLKAEFNGTTEGLEKSRVAGFELRGKLNRFDYGLHWNALTEAGGVVVGNEIKIEINAELILAEQQANAA